MLIRICLLIFFIGCSLSENIAQADNISWSSVRLRHQLSDKTRVDLRPIVRHNQDFSNYQNTSIDVAIHHKLPKNWFIQFLSRTWFLPDSPEGQFLWGDVGHQWKHEKFTLTNRVRLHISLNINEINPADWIRYQTVITPKVPWKVKPFLSIEPWWQLGSAQEFRRIRYEPGVNYKLADKFNLTVMYRRQDTLNIDPSNDQNHYVITLTYNL